MKQRKRMERFLQVLAATAGLLSVLLLAAVLGYILVRGLPALQDELMLSNVDAMIGIFSIGFSIWNTVIVFLISFLLSVPIGIGAGISLVYYVRWRPMRSAMIFYANFMASLPSILYGMAGAMVVAGLLGGRQSLLAGALTLTVMLVPQVLALTIRIIRDYGAAQPLASVALGSSGWDTIRHIVLPDCLGQILYRSTLLAGQGLGGGGGPVLHRRRGHGGRWQPGPQPDPKRRHLGGDGVRAGRARGNELRFCGRRYPGIAGGAAAFCLLSHWIVCEGVPAFIGPVSKAPQTKLRW